MHEGHRRRMYEKLKAGDNIFEHELLEMLLFNAYPRKNTNPVAHELLNRFPSISAVLSASFEELIAVPGVGEQVALYLMCLGKCIERGNRTDCFTVIKNRGEAFGMVGMRLGGKTAEVLEIYLLDRNGKVLRICSYTSDECHKVTVKPEEIIKLISVSRPYGILVAHNHTSGSARPSPADDDFTKECQIICSMNNVRFYDHIIYAAPDNIFSYFDSGKLTEIERKFSIGSIIGNEKRF